MPEIEQDPKLDDRTLSAPGDRRAAVPGAGKSDLFAEGRIHLSTDAIHTVKPAGGGHSQGQADRGHRRVRLRQDHADSGKPGARRWMRPVRGPDSCRPMCKAVEAEGIQQVKLIDATPIGINVRSTVATYANVHDELRKIFANTEDAKAARLQGRRFLLQHGQTALPGVRRHRRHQPGRAVLAGCGDPLPRMPRFPLCQRG